MLNTPYVSPPRGGNEGETRTLRVMSSFKDTQMRVTEKLGASKAKWIAGQKRRGVPTKEIAETANISARWVGKLRAWYKDAKTRVVPVATMSSAATMPQEGVLGRCIYDAH